MGYEQTDYVYKITVDGTDIREYYDLETRLSESEVAQMWLDDAAERNGSYLGVVFRDRVVVELLTEVDDAQQNDKLEPGPIPLPPPPEKELSGKDET